MPTYILHLLLLLAFSIGLFDAVGALKCYDQSRPKNSAPNWDNIAVVECDEDQSGCMVALECSYNYLEKTDLRYCTSDKNISQSNFYGSKTFNDSCKHCEYCSGDLCNNIGLEKTGLKCIGKSAGSDVPFVEECVTGQVGCVAALDCKDLIQFKTEHGCFTNKDGCKTEAMPNSADGKTLGEVCSCNYCTTDLCNDGGIKVKPTIEGSLTTKKPTPAEIPQPPKTELEKPKIVEKRNSQENHKANGMEDKLNPKTADGEKQQTATDENDEEVTTAPPNGAAVGIVGWGQIGIIPIGMMTFVLGAVLKMLTI